MTALSQCSAGLHSGSLWQGVALTAAQKRGVLAQAEGHCSVMCRGMGAFEGLRISTAEPQVREGDLSSPDWRPPHGMDGTPNESVNDLLVRVRQVRPHPTQLQGG